MGLQPLVSRRRLFAAAGGIAAGALAEPARRKLMSDPSGSVPPNLVVILTDDQGLADVGAYGTPDIRTPGIDRVFREGMAFRNAYANSPVCSPTRAALLTGCNPDRVGVPGVIRTRPDDSWGYLDPRATLLPALLKKSGYDTAIVGKWHLGLEPPNTPLDHGFDHFHGFLGDMMDDYWTHRREGQNYMRLDRRTIDPQGHATDLFTEWACAYLSEPARKRRPFFLYLAYNAPHSPIQPPPDWIERVRAREPAMDARRARLLALIEHMDSGVGRVLDALDRTGLASNSLVVFLSDNGGVLGDGANNGPWRSEKQHVYEGGIRVPFAVRWPGRVAPGSSSDRPVMAMDLFPTLVEAARLAVPAHIDGVSFLPEALGQTPPPLERDLYFVRREGSVIYGGKTIEAIRRGRWKLIQDSPYAPLELYDLEADPRETTNLATREPAVVRELSAALRRHIQEAGRVPWQPPR